MAGCCTDPPELELTWDRTTASNGDRAHLTIKRTAADPQGYSTLILGVKTDAANASLYHLFVTQ
jgi:hypothetical protein